MFSIIVVAAVIAGAIVRILSHGGKDDLPIVEAILSYPMLLLAAISIVGITFGQRVFTPSAPHAVADLIYAIMVVPISAHTVDVIVRIRRTIRGDHNEPSSEK